MREDKPSVLSGSSDETMRVWDVQTGQCEHTLEGHSGGVGSVVFSPDGSRVASGSDDNTVRVWDIAELAEIFCYDAGTNKQNINSSNDSSNILVNGKWLSLSSQNLLFSATAESPGSPSGLAISTLGVSHDWVTSSSGRTLWLPPEYRPGTWASHSDMIVLGSGTGRITFIRHITRG